MTLQIRIEFPTIMKMFMTSEIEILTSSTLDEIKEIVFSAFWKQFQVLIPRAVKHGSAELVILKDKNFIIRSNEDLQERLMQTNSFQAVFEGNH